MLGWKTYAPSNRCRAELHASRLVAGIHGIVRQICGAVPVGSVFVQPYRSSFLSTKALKCFKPRSQLEQRAEHQSSAYGDTKIVNITTRLNIAASIQRVSISQFHLFKTSQFQVAWQPATLTGIPAGHLWLGCSVHQGLLHHSICGAQ